MTTLALHMIARNSENTLYNTLQSVIGLFDQIVVVDTGSTDKTIDVAKSFNAEVYEFPWVDDFSKARDYALSKVRCDWAMWLDTGDLMTKESVNNLCKFFHGDNSLEQCDLVWLNINRKLNPNGTPFFTMIVPRIARMASNPVWERPIHETITTTIGDEPRSVFFPDAEINDPHSDLVGGAMRNLRILDKMIAEGDTSTRTMYYRGQELRDLGRTQEAINQWLEYIKQAPITWEYYDALMNIGKCYFTRNTGNDWVDAFGYFLWAISVDPTEPDAWRLIALCYTETGKYENAIPFICATINMKVVADGRPRNLTFYGEYPLEEIAICYFKIEKYTEALDYFTRAKSISKSPEMYDEKIQALVSLLENDVLLRSEQ
jgi:tetratricopeptide (TPR) repeat protein